MDLKHEILHMVYCSYRQANQRYSTIRVPGMAIQLVLSNIVVSKVGMQRVELFLFTLTTRTTYVQNRDSIRQ